MMEAGDIGRGKKFLSLSAILVREKVREFEIY